MSNIKFKFQVFENIFRFYYQINLFFCTLNSLYYLNKCCPVEATANLIVLMNVSFDNTILYICIIIYSYNNIQLLTYLLTLP